MEAGSRHGDASRDPGRDIVGRAIIAWLCRAHYLFTLLVLAPLLGHIGLATVHPRTRASLRGMLFGVVDAAWARDHHPRWYAEVSRATPSRPAREDGGEDSPPGRVDEGL